MRNADSLYSMEVGGKTDVHKIAGATHVKRLVYAIDPPPSKPPPSPGGAHFGAVQLHAAVYLDGVRQTSNKVISIEPAASVPTDLQSKHLWPAAHPSFESPQCVNVKALPTPAKGDGYTDDYAAIQGALDAHECVFLPRGLYITSRTLQLHAGRALIGVAKHLTRVTSLDAGLTAPPRHPNPLRAPDAALLPVVEVLPSAESEEGQQSAPAHTTLAFLSISTWNTLNTTTALHFHADDGIYRQVHANRANRCGSLYRPGCIDSVRINYPLQLVQGAKRLKMYTFFEEDCCHEHVTKVSKAIPGYPAYWQGYLAGPQGPLYRHLKVADTHGVGFYHLNCEHGTGESICEFTDSTDLDVYGLKTEGRFVTLWVRDCDRVSVFGTGGCGCSSGDTVYPPDFAKGYPPTLYRVERTPNFQFSSLIDQHSMIRLSDYPNSTPTTRPRDMFDEGGCEPPPPRLAPTGLSATVCWPTGPPPITHMLYVAQGHGSPPLQTHTYDRPALYLFGEP